MMTFPATPAEKAAVYQTWAYIWAYLIWASPAQHYAKANNDN